MFLNNDVVRDDRIKGHQQVHQCGHRFDHAHGHVRPNRSIQGDDFRVGVFGYFRRKTYQKRVIGNGPKL